MSPEKIIAITKEAIEFPQTIMRIYAEDTTWHKFYKDIKKSHGRKRKVKKQAKKISKARTALKSVFAAMASVSSATKIRLIQVQPEKSFKYGETINVNVNNKTNLPLRLRP